MQFPPPLFGKHPNPQSVTENRDLSGFGIGQNGFLFTTLNAGPARGAPFQDMGISVPHFNAFIGTRFFAAFAPVAKISVNPYSHVLSP
jgi:hypothetical protein